MEFYDQLGEGIKKMKEAGEENLRRQKRNLKRARLQRKQRLQAKHLDNQAEQELETAEYNVDKKTLKKKYLDDDVIDQEIYKKVQDQMNERAYQAKSKFIR